MKLAKMIFDRVHEKVETECEANGGVKTEGSKMLLDLIDVIMDNDEACDFAAGCFVVFIVGLTENNDPEISERAEKLLALFANKSGMEQSELDELKAELLEIFNSIEEV